MRHVIRKCTSLESPAQCLLNFDISQSGTASFIHKNEFGTHAFQTVWILVPYGIGYAACENFFFRYSFPVISNLHRPSKSLGECLII